MFNTTTDQEKINNAFIGFGKEGLKINFQISLICETYIRDAILI